MRETPAEPGDPPAKPIQRRVWLKSLFHTLVDAEGIDGELAVVVLRNELEATVAKIPQHEQRFELPTHFQRDWYFGRSR